MNETTTNRDRPATASRVPAVGDTVRWNLRHDPIAVRTGTVRLVGRADWPQQQVYVDTDGHGVWIDAAAFDPAGENVIEAVVVEAEAVEAGAVEVQR